MRFFVILCLTFCFPLKAFVQDSLVSRVPIARNKKEGNYLLLKDVVIAGNDKTRPATILRELPFEIGQKYPLHILNERLSAAQTLLMNTGLFRKAIVKLKDVNASEAIVSVDLEERWYIYPIPFIRPVDNSFFQWATQKDRDFERLNYGINVTHNNLTGRNDRLNVKFMNGFTRQLGIQYNNLYLDGDMKWSTNVGFEVGNNRAVNYKTENNQLVPLKTENDDFVHSFVKAYAEINYRKAIKMRHTFGIGFNRDRVADTVFQLNPKFNLDPGKKGYADLYYRAVYTDVDFLPYPTKGWLAEASITKKGIGSELNLWQLSAKTSATWPAGKQQYFNLVLAGMVKLPFEQPYITQRFIGSGNMFLQGYENYVIDGVAGGYIKAAFGKQLFNKILNLPAPKWQQLKALHALPFRLYAKAFINAGYVYNQNPGTNNLTNKMLCSGGVGLDIITLTDLVIKIEWSFNLLGQNGLYLHPGNSF
jgi:outer membrane protein assembly factor BamA